MKVLLFASLLVVLVYKTSADDDVMCDILDENKSRVEMIFGCIEALASPELKYRLRKMKDETYCDKTYICMVGVACLNPPYNAFMLQSMEADADIFCEYHRLNKVCRKEKSEEIRADTRSNALNLGS